MMNVWKACKNCKKKKFVDKMLMKIDTCSQFYQQFKSNFWANIISPKNYKAKL